MKLLIAVLLISQLNAAQLATADSTMKTTAEPTFRAATNLVIVSLSAKDRNGNPISGLTSSDFVLTEDGKPQQIRFFEFQQLGNAPLPQPGFAVRNSSQTPDREAVSPTTAVTIKTAGPGQSLYKDRRLVVLFFDQASMSVAEQYQAQQGALKFLNTQMTQSDMVALMTYDTDLNVLSDFTADRDHLVQMVKALNISDKGMSNGSTGADNEGDTGAAFSQDDSEFNIFNTDRKLAALESAARMLGQLSEKKALVYFASGTSRTGIDNQAQLRATINAAIRSNVAFYPVDARGLTALAPIGDATQASPGGQAIFSGASQRASLTSFQDSQETLYTLATDTGGKATLDTNDLSQGIVQAQKSIDTYYTLGYYSTNPALDGHFRRINVQLSRGVAARLDYRSGYFAGKEFRHYDSSDRERQLQEALMLGDPVTDLSIAAEVNYFRQTRDRYFVPVAVKMPGSDIQLAKKGGAQTTRLDFIGEVRDAKGALQGSVRDNLLVKLRGQSTEELASHTLEYDTGFTLQPGTYSLKFIARENETGKLGTFETRFKVPDLTAERDYLPISSVVLSAQREDLNRMTASAERDKKLLAANPLVQEGRKLVPSVTRVFRKEQEMYVYLEAYEPGAGDTQMLVATLGFYRGQQKVFETAPAALTEGLNGKSKAVPVSLSVPLAGMTPGRYTCQVTVLQPSAEKFAVWRAAVVLLP